MIPPILFPNERPSTTFTLHLTIIAPRSRPPSFPMEVNQTSMITRTLQDEMATGLRLHRAGRLDEAAHVYETALARDPADADACCLLGVVRNQQGQPAEAVELIGTN